MNKVLCDQMLGSLAKWLRILGIDTYFAENTIDDNELLTIAEIEKRVLITKDKELIIRARKQKIPTIHIKSIELFSQLQTVLKHITPDSTQVLSRCTICNTPIITVDKSSAIDHVPKKVFSSKELFFYCPTCDKYYWQGSHYDKIQEKISELLKKQK